MLERLQAASNGVPGTMGLPIRRIRFSVPVMQALAPSSIDLLQKSVGEAQFIVVKTGN
jgi:hypothetical protein